MSLPHGAEFNVLERVNGREYYSHPDYPSLAFELLADTRVDESDWDTTRLIELDSAATREILTGLTETVSDDDLKYDPERYDGFYVALGALGIDRQAVFWTGKPQIMLFGALTREKVSSYFQRSQ